MLLLRSAAFNLSFYAVSTIIVIAATPLFLCPRRLTLWLIKGWSTLTLWLLKALAGTGYIVRGNLPEGGVLVASKHQSMWDTIVMTAILNDPALVMKRELLWIPFYGWYAYKAGMIAIDRGAGSAAIRRLIAQGKAARKPGTIVLEFREPIPAGLDRKSFMATLESRIEGASARLIADADAVVDKPPPVARG